MRRECRERFPRNRRQRKQLVSDPGMHYGTCVAHVPDACWDTVTRGGGECVLGIPGARAARNFTNLVRGPWINQSREFFKELLWASIFVFYLDHGIYVVNIWRHLAV